MERDGMGLLERRMRCEGEVKKRVAEDGEELRLDGGANDEGKGNGDGFGRGVEIEDGVSWSDGGGKGVRETAIDFCEKRRGGVGWVLWRRRK